MNHSHSFRVSGAVVLVLAIAWAAWAAPFTRPLNRLHDEVQTLARIDEIELIVEPLQAEIRDLGIKEDEIRSEWIEKLRNAGFEVVKGKDVPKMHVWVFMGTDERVEDGAAYFVSVTLEQEILVKRLDLAVRVPTWTGLRWGVMPKQESKRQLKKVIENLRLQFLLRQKQATMAG